MAGGNNGSANLASMLTLLPGASVWTALAPLPRSLYGAGALFVGGRLRLTGGRDDGGSYRSEVSDFRTQTFNLDNVQNSSTKVLEYYPVPWNTWVNIGNLPSGRALHAVLPIGPQHIACVAGEVRLSKILVFSSLSSDRMLIESILECPQLPPADGQPCVSLAGTQV